MANTIESQILVSGSRNLTIKIHIDGDGSGEETNTVVVDASALGFTECKVMSIQASFTGFSAELIWDGATDKHMMNIPDYDVHQDYYEFGGLINNATTPTGDILMTTTGLGAGDTGHFILELKVKE